MKDLYDKIVAIAKKVRINSKEEGVRTLWPLMGSQEYLLREIAKGIEEGVHTFVVLKARQLGVSTLCNLLDIYWTHKFKGMQGTVVTEAEKTREQFRNTLRDFMAGLPYELQIRIRAHNRMHLVLGNRSRLVYQVAGTKVSSSSAALGQGEGISYMHATECASWADEEGLASLMSSLAEKNPRRLYVFESTAKGYGLWHDMWETANMALSQRAIFVGWWRNEGYSFPQDSLEFKTYWDGNLTGSEGEWVRAVKRLYDFEIRPEQIAWHRWQLNEKQHGDEQYMHQNYPATAEMAFQMAGTSWFHPQVLARCWSKAHQLRHSAKHARFHFGEEFSGTRLMDATPKTGTLTIWEPPVQGGHYVVGADPAEGSSVNADEFAIEVYRCYADRMVQVAEFADVDINTYEFAWALLSLCGAYKARYCLEINGCGGAVYEEMKNVRRQAFSTKYMTSDTGVGLSIEQMKGLRDAVKNIRDYFYQRVDMAGGKSNAVHWKTNFDNKRYCLSLLRDVVTREIMEVKSERLVNQMRKIRRQDDGDIRADGKGKDDKVIAAALAAVTWYQDVRPQLMALGLTQAKSRELEERHKDVSPSVSVEQLMVVDYLKRAGILPKKARIA